MTTFNTREAVDFVIIGSGAAGGILAKELSTAGFSTVVLEQGKHRKAPEFTHDEIKYFLNGEMIRAAGRASPACRFARPRPMKRRTWTGRSGDVREDSRWLQRYLVGSCVAHAADRLQ